MYVNGLYRVRNILPSILLMSKHTLDEFIGFTSTCVLSVEKGWTVVPKWGQVRLQNFNAYWHVI